MPVCSLTQLRTDVLTKHSLQPHSPCYRISVHQPSIIPITRHITHLIYCLAPPSLPASLPASLPHRILHTPAVPANSPVTVAFAHTLCLWPFRPLISPLLFSSCRLPTRPSPCLHRHSGFALGVAANATFSLLCDSQPWQLQVALQCVPMAAALCTWRWIYDSPQYYFAHLGPRHTLWILGKIAAVNGAEPPEDMPVMCPAPWDRVRERKTCGDHLRKLVRRRRRARVIGLWFAWFAACLLYYGLTLGAGKLVGDAHVNSILLACAELPAFWLCWRLVKRRSGGWRRTQATALVVAGSSLLIAWMVGVTDETSMGNAYNTTGGGRVNGSMEHNGGAISSDAISNTTLSSSAVVAGWQLPVAAQVIAATVGKMGASTAFVTCHIMVPDTFPGDVRGTGLGISALSARLGGLLATGVFRAAPPLDALLCIALIGLCAAACAAYIDLRHAPAGASGGNSVKCTESGADRDLHSTMPTRANADGNDGSLLNAGQSSSTEEDEEDGDDLLLGGTQRMPGPWEVRMRELNMPLPSETAPTEAAVGRNHDRNSDRSLRQATVAVGGNAAVDLENGLTVSVGGDTGGRSSGNVLRAGGVIGGVNSGGVGDDVIGGVISGGIGDDASGGENSDVYDDGAVGADDVVDGSEDDEDDEDTWLPTVD